MQNSRWPPHGQPKGDSPLPDTAGRGPAERCCRGQRPSIAARSRAAAGVKVRPGGHGEKTLCCSMCRTLGTFSPSILSFGFCPPNIHTHHLLQPPKHVSPARTKSLLLRKELSFTRLYKILQCQERALYFNFVSPI